MPIYKFECSECGFDFEHIMSVKEGQTFNGIKSDCPKCEKRKCVKKVMSPSNFKINGYSERNGYSSTSEEK